MAAIVLEVSYAQLAVFDAHLPDPFNDWLDGHLAQGFAWRPGSVSFWTLEERGPISLSLPGAPVLPPETGPVERAIAVPFSVPTHGEVEVATIGGSVPLRLPSGEHELVFEHGRGPGGAMWARLEFRRVRVPAKPRILVADPALTPPAEFLMGAEPA